MYLNREDHGRMEGTPRGGGCAGAGVSTGSRLSCYDIHRVVIGPHINNQWQ